MDEIRDFLRASPSACLSYPGWNYWFCQGWSLSHNDPLDESLDFVRVGPLLVGLFMFLDESLDVVRAGPLAYVVLDEIHDTVVDDGPLASTGAQEMSVFCFAFAEFP